MINPIGYLDCKKEPELLTFRNCVHRDEKCENIFNERVCFDKCSLEIPSQNRHHLLNYLILDLRYANDKVCFFYV